MIASLIVLAGSAAGMTIAVRGWWLPLLANGRSDYDRSSVRDEHAGHHHGADSGHGRDDRSVVPLSDQARANLGLKLGAVELTDYHKNLVIPGVVVEQPGHSERRITTSLTGVVVNVHAFPGQAVKPGDPLLDIQPTGELLTNAQASLIRTLQEMELVETEIERLTPLVENGSIPKRTLIEKDYERKRLDSQKVVQIQELLVRGLSADQITEMVAHKTLLREFTIHVPGGKPRPVPKTDDHDHPSVVPAGMAPVSPRFHAAADVVYTVEKIDIFPGKLVQPGDELCDLGLHTELYLEGHAFERDSRLIARTVQQRQPLAALFESESETPELREGLVIRYVESMLNPATRTLRFFVPLRNEVLEDSVTDDGLVYRSWRFKPGQKVRLLLPVEDLPQQIVVPADAVVTEGPDAYVFRANGRLMERVPVVIESRDPRFVVLRNDGSVSLGDVIALNQAFQINLALRKRQGSETDVHAGHQH